MSNVLVFDDVSCGGVLSVITVIICVFTPLIVFVTVVVSVHAYVKMLHTNALYNLSLRPQCRSLSCQICLNLSNRVCDITIRSFASVISCGRSSLGTWTVRRFPFCYSFLFITFASATAVFVTLMESMSVCPVLVLWASKSCDLEYDLSHVSHRYLPSGSG